MQLTTGNYFSEIKNIDFDQMPWLKADTAASLKESHEWLVKATQGGKTWRAYKESSKVKGVIDAYLTTLNQAISKRPAAKANAPKQKKGSQGRKKAPAKSKAKEPAPKETPEKKPSASTWEPEAQPEDFNTPRVTIKYDDPKEVEGKNGMLKLVGYGVYGDAIYEDEKGWRYRPYGKGIYDKEPLRLTPYMDGSKPNTEDRNPTFRLAYPPTPPQGQQTKDKAPARSSSGFTYEVDPQEVDERIEVEWEAARTVKHPQHGTLRLVGFNYLGRPVYEDKEGWRYKPSSVWEDDLDQELIVVKDNFGPPSDPQRRDMDVRLAFPPKKPRTKRQSKKDTEPAKGRKQSVKSRKKNTGGTTKKSGRKKTPPKITKELLPDLGVELSLIGRFVNLNDKPKSYQSVLNVFKAVQRAIQKGHVRKSKRKTAQGEVPPTVYHKEIAWIQDKLLWVLQNVYQFKGKDPDEIRVFTFEPKDFDPLVKIKKDFARFPSIGYAIRFVGMQGKSPEKEKVEKLLAAIEKAKEQGKIGKDDPNAGYIPKITRSLKLYTEGSTAKVQLAPATLNGIAAVLDGCACGHQLYGPGDPDQGQEYFYAYNTERGEYFGLVWDGQGKEILEIPNGRTMAALIEFGRIKSYDDVEGVEAHLKATGKIRPQDWVSYVSEDGVERDGQELGKFPVGTSEGGSEEPADADAEKQATISEGGSAVEAEPTGESEGGGITVNADDNGDDTTIDDNGGGDPTGGGSSGPTEGESVHVVSDPGDGGSGHDFIIPPPKGNAVSFSSDNMPPTKGSTYPFAGRWGALFRQPSIGFSTIIYGQPKSGKSTMAADLGGYLARNFGTVLYASIEEGDRETLRQRFDRLGVNHPDLHVKNFLPGNLTNYDFVIVDSASRGLMEISALRSIIQQWPNTNFFFLFHVTNKGLPRGGTQYRHEVDVLVEVKEGVAYADGRFGPGEMQIRFE